MLGLNSGSLPTSLCKVAILGVAKLPDLMPNLWALQHSLRIEERPLHALTCAMEENCLSSSAYTARSYGSNSYSGSSYMFGGW